MEGTAPQNLYPPAQPTPEERTWALFCHLGTFSGMIGVPLGFILAPLILWLVKRDTSAFVDRHGKEVLNFQISMTIYAVAALALLGGGGFLGSILLGPVLIPLFMMIIPVVLGLMIFEIVVTIMAAMEANNGRLYCYPLTIRFLR